MRLVSGSEAPARAPIPDSPLATVYFDSAGEDSDVGMLRVDVPPGATMRPYRHHGSDVVLTAVRGAVRLSTGEETIEVRTGDAALVFKEETVALSNPHDGPAQVIVAAGPATSVDAVRRRSVRETQMDLTAAR